LLGPNGAGKSTTLLMLAGVLVPDRGRIGYAGVLGPERPVVRRTVGFVPQGLAIYEDLTAAENLRFFARLHRVERGRVAERVERALELAGLEDHRHRRVRTFSGGMQRRLNLACATLHEPDFLLLDEPTVGVDPQSRDHIFSSIERLKASGLTIVYSTHYMEEAERLCDRVAIMDGGKVLAEGTRDELIHQHGGELSVAAEFLPEVTLQVVSGEANVAPGPRRLAFRSGSADEVLRRLMSEPGRLSELTVRRPNLESVFLALTGRSLRDE
jgi:ABC-2 type transport system ATP-binding protein